MNEKPQRGLFLYFVHINESQQLHVNKVSTAE